MSKNPNISVNDKIHFWTVKEIKNLTTIICECKCGTKKTWRHIDFVRGITKGCKKCYSPYENKHNIKVGDCFGSWTIIDEEKKRDKFGLINWHVQCKCGYISFRRASSLIRKTSIRCKVCAVAVNFKGVGELSLKYFHNIRYGAIERSLIFDVDIEYVWQLFLDQEKKCKLSGMPLQLSKYSKKSKDWFETTASLDRIDSSKGYVQGNLQWVHKLVNIMKQDMTDKEFIKWCNTVANYNQKHD